MKPPPDPPTQATPKELQEYVQKMKGYAKQVEEQTNKDKIRMHSEVQKEKKTLKQKEQDLKDAQEELKTKVYSFSTQEAELKIKEDKLKATEDLLEMNQKDPEKEKEDLLKEQDQLAARDVDLSQRETNIKAAEKSNKVKEEHFKSPAKKLLEKEEELKVEEARLEVLKAEILDVAPGKDMEATILLEQKQLLEKCLSQNENTERLIARQMKLEEDREARERKRDKKEEESLATGKGNKPPSFKGNPGDRPGAHILRAEDWMDASNPDMKDAAKVKNFRLTLDHHAREWYDKADCKTSWKKMKLEFSRYFSTQGRSMRNLLSR